MGLTIPLFYVRECSGCPIDTIREMLFVFLFWRYRVVYFSVLSEPEAEGRSKKPAGGT